MTGFNVKVGSLAKIALTQTCQLTLLPNPGPVHSNMYPGAINKPAGGPASQPLQQQQAQLQQLAGAPVLQNKRPSKVSPRHTQMLAGSRDFTNVLGALGSLTRQDMGIKAGGLVETATQGLHPTFKGAMEELLGI